MRKVQRRVFGAGGKIVDLPEEKRESDGKKLEVATPKKRARKASKTPAVEPAKTEEE